MKTHYRKVFKSDYLGQADIEDYIEEGKSLIFTIKEVKQYVKTNDKNSGISVAGKVVSANIAYFTDPKVKPLVLNATNSKIVKSFANGSPFVDDWKNITIELYVDETVKMKGDVVGGVRIKPVQPKASVKRIFTVDNFEKAKTAGADIDKVKTIYTVSKEVEMQYIEYYGAKK